jgi:hypothetical protein
VSSDFHDARPQQCAEADNDGDQAQLRRGGAPAGAVMKAPALDTYRFAAMRELPVASGKQVASLLGPAVR